MYILKAVIIYAYIRLHCYLLRSVTCTHTLCAQTYLHGLALIFTVSLHNYSASSGSDSGSDSGSAAASRSCCRRSRRSRKRGRAAREPQAAIRPAAALRFRFCRRPRKQCMFFKDTGAAYLLGLGSARMIPGADCLDQCNIRQW